MTFSRIYRTRAWGTGESASGPGSGSAATRAIRESLLQLARELGVQTTLDVACGDGFWMPDLPGYQGIDVAPEAVALAHRRHPDRWYRVADIRRGMWHPRDLVICRDVMQHLSQDDGLGVLRAIRATGSRWLLASTFVDGENIDIETGQAYRPNLATSPFSLGPPSRMIFDGYDYELGTEPRDPGKHLGLWHLG